MYFTYQSHNKSDGAVKTQFFSIHVNEGSAYRLQVIFFMHVMFMSWYVHWQRYDCRSEIEQNESESVI